MEKRKLRQESGNSGDDAGSGCGSTMIKWGAIIFIVLAIVGMCKGGDEEEKKGKKASQRTEQVTHTGEKEESVDENVSEEETPRAASKEESADSFTNEEQATASLTSEEQVFGNLTETEEEAETPAHTTTEQTVYDLVEQMPEFPGGNAKLEKYLESHLQYPAVAQEDGTQGRVTMQFVVNTDGSISDAKVIRSLDTSCDEEALRLINSMPRWIPGQQDGKNVRVKYTLPITFKLP